MNKPTLFYEGLQELVDTAKPEWPIINEIFGKGTEYEAICRIFNDEDTGDWNGFMVFKDIRYSPLEAEILQFKYFPPGGASGAVALCRAEGFWTTLTGIFKSLQEGQNVVLSPER